MEVLDCPKHPAEVHVLLWAPADAPPFRASRPRWQTPRSHPLKSSASERAPPATFTRPLETLRPGCPPAPTLHLLNPPQNTRRPAPHPGSRRPPPRASEGLPTDTHISFGSSLPDPVEAGASTWSGRAQGIRRGGRGALPEAPSASLPTRCGGFSLSQDREGGEMWEGRGKTRSLRVAGAEPEPLALAPPSSWRRALEHSG